MREPILTRYELFGAECMIRGKYIYKTECIRRWDAGSKEIPKEKAAKFFGVSIPVFDGVLALIKEHPDWDDETIADHAAWR